MTAALTRYHLALESPRESTIALVRLEVVGHLHKPKPPKPASFARDIPTSYASRRRIYALIVSATTNARIVHRSDASPPGTLRAKWSPENAPERRWRRRRPQRSLPCYNSCAICGSSPTWHNTFSCSKGLSKLTRILTSRYAFAPTAHVLHVDRVLRIAY
jgi:hypothetical protein